MGQYFTAQELNTLLETLGHDHESLKKVISAEKAEQDTYISSLKEDIANLFKELAKLKQTLFGTTKRANTLGNLIKKL